MKNYEKFWRVEKISEKLKDPTAGTLLHIDFDSFSEAEKVLFRKVDEISEEYERTGNDELLAENSDLIYKNLEIMHKRIKELYCWTIPTVIAGYSAIDRESIDYFFQLHFMNFEADFLQCIKHLHTWTKHDIDEFLSDLRKSGACYFRIPRGSNESNSKEIDENAKSEISTAVVEEKQEG
jgi:hypothetical protein